MHLPEPPRLKASLVPCKCEGVEWRGKKKKGARKKAYSGSSKLANIVFPAHLSLPGGPGETALWAQRWRAAWALEVSSVHVVHGLQRPKQDGEKATDWRQGWRSPDCHPGVRVWGKEKWFQVVWLVCLLNRVVWASGFQTEGFWGTTPLRDQASAV